MKLLKKTLLSKPVVFLSRPFRRLLTGWPWPVTFQKKVAGRKMYVDLRTSIGREILLTGSFDPAVFQPIADHLRNGDTYIDVGANIGYYCLLALGKIGPTGHVHAFDIDPRPLQMLRKTIRKNAIHNLHLHAIALGDHVGSSQLYQEADSGHSYVAPAPGGSSVSMTTLDELVDQGVITAAHVLKIDVEGGELRVLHGAEKFLRKFKPFVICEVDEGHLQRNSASAAFIENFFQKLGYSTHRLAGAGTSTLIATPR